MASLGAGALRETLVVLQATTTTDSHGTAVASAWTTLDSLPAELLADVRGAERIASEQLRTVTTYRFRVRARSDVTTGMRAEWRPSWLALSTPKALEIRSVAPINDGRQWMVLECGEAV